MPDPTVLHPMLALSIRCSSHPFWKEQPKLNAWIRALTEKSWQDLLDLYGKEDIGLHYLQGLCLLAQVDFAGKSDFCAYPLAANTDYHRWKSAASAYPDSAGHPARAVLGIPRQIQQW